MALQSTVNLYPAIGVAGDRVSNNPRAYTALNFLAGEDGVTVGRFVWRSSTAGLVENAGSDAPLGLVERSLENYNYDLLSEGSMVIPEGGAVEVAVRGDFLVENSGSDAATVGMKAYANLTTGAVTFADSGSTVSGSIETSFVAQTAGAAGELIAVSNQ